MQSKASAMNSRIAPRKARMIINFVRGKHAAEAIQLLSFTAKAGAPIVKKLIESAMANATDISKGAVDIDKLWVKSIHVDQGPTQRRYLPRAMGRATPVHKKSSHLHVVLSDVAVKKAKK